MLTIKNLGKNGIIVDGVLIRNDDEALLQKESEVIIGGEPVIVHNYEYVKINAGENEVDYEEYKPVQGTNLKDYLLWYYKQKKNVDPRKDPMM